MLRDDELEQRVAEELQALVGRKLVVSHSQAVVGQALFQELLILEAVSALVQIGRASCRERV